MEARVVAEGVPGWGDFGSRQNPVVFLVGFLQLLKGLVLLTGPTPRAASRQEFHKKFPPSIFELQSG